MLVLVLALVVVFPVVLIVVVSDITEELGAVEPLSVLLVLVETVLPPPPRPPITPRPNNNPRIMPARANTPSIPIKAFGHPFFSYG